MKTIIILLGYVAAVSTIAGAIVSHARSIILSDSLNRSGEIATAFLMMAVACWVAILILWFSRYVAGNIAS